MKKLLLLFFILNTAAYSKTIKIKDVRLLFEQSASDETACKNLVQLLNNITENNNTTLAAYKACATMMMANYTYNPFSKLSYFNDGKSLLEKCIARETNNIEVRYLRFTVQSSAPGFLGYSSSIQEDKKFILNRLITLNDLTLKQKITGFLKTSEYLTSKEKQNLKS